MSHQPDFSACSSGGHAKHGHSLLPHPTPPGQPPFPPSYLFFQLLDSDFEPHSVLSYILSCKEPIMLYTDPQNTVPSDPTNCTQLVLPRQNISSIPRSSSSFLANVQCYLCCLHNLHQKQPLGLISPSLGWFNPLENVVKVECHYFVRFVTWLGFYHSA